MSAVEMVANPRRAHDPFAPHKVPADSLPAAPILKPLGEDSGWPVASEWLFDGRLETEVTPDFEAMSKKDLAAWAEENGLELPKRGTQKAWADLAEEHHNHIQAEAATEETSDGISD